MSLDIMFLKRKERTLYALADTLQYVYTYMLYVLDCRRHISCSVAAWLEKCFRHRDSEFLHRDQQFQLRRQMALVISKHGGNVLVSDAKSNRERRVFDGGTKK